MAQSDLTAFLQVLVIPIISWMFVEIRRLNARIELQAELIGKLDTRLENCLQGQSQSGKWQAGQSRQRDMLINQSLDPDKTPPPDE